MTRAESQERTRARVVESATTLFLRDGFRATSVEQVAAEAGYTVGAVYSNFANKTDLGIAVIDAVYEREIDRVVAAVAGPPDRWLRLFTDWQDSALGDQAMTRLEIEVNAFSG